MPPVATQSEHIKAFLKAVKADKNLQEKLKGMVHAESIVSAAKEAGLSLSVEAIDKMMTTKELSDKDLETMAGRFWHTDVTPFIGPGAMRVGGYAAIG